MAQTLKVSSNRLWRGGRLTNHLSRLKYFRGHGVHSPFIYSIARSVFMSRHLHSDATALFEQLVAIKGITPKVAVEIANLAAHCNYKSISIDSSHGEDMIICSEEAQKDDILSLVDTCTNNGRAIVILLPYRRQALCNSMLESHNCTSIDRLNYMVLLNNHLPKQHFKL